MTRRRKPVAPDLHAPILAAHLAGDGRAAIAAQTGIPPATVRRLLRDVDTETLAKGFATVADLALERITEERLDRLNAVQLVTTAAIAVDKRAVLRGEPSAIIGHTHEAAGALDRLCEAIVSERERRRTLAAETAAGNGGTR